MLYNIFITHMLGICYTAFVGLRFIYYCLVLLCLQILFLLFTQPILLLPLLRVLLCSPVSL